MSEVVERVETSWAGLMDAIKGIPEARLSQPGAAGDWSVKDVLAHVAYWEGRAIGLIEREMSDEPAPSSGLDVETINQNVYGERSDWTAAQVLDELYGTHDRFMAALRMFPDIDADIIEGDTFEHYDEHAADISRWRERAGI